MDLFHVLATLSLGERSPVSNECSAGPKVSMVGVRKREISEIDGTQTLTVWSSSLYLVSRTA